jgi:hypothetical protein
MGREKAVRNWRNGLMRVRCGNTESWGRVFFCYASVLVVGEIVDMT